MAVKTQLYGTSHRAAVLHGVSQSSSAVKATLGSKGRNVVLDKKWGSPTITKHHVGALV